jgi:hypothetical protein
MSEQNTTNNADQTSALRAALSPTADTDVNGNGYTENQVDAIRSALTAMAEIGDSPAMIPLPLTLSQETDYYQASTLDGEFVPSIKLKESLLPLNVLRKLFVASRPIALHMIDDIPITSGVTALVSEAQSGKSIFVNNLVKANSDIGYVAWAEPDPIPGLGSPGAITAGPPAILSMELERAFATADFNVLDSAREFMIGGRGLQAGALSGAYINTVLTRLHLALVARGQGLLIVINVQAAKGTPAYANALQAISGAVGAVVTMQEYAVGQEPKIRVVRSREADSLLEEASRADGITDGNSHSEQDGYGGEVTDDLVISPISPWS